ncbi:hypothetical protein I317_01923, partial [Kwoniella heveanensis CBS 569]
MSTNQDDWYNLTIDIPSLGQVTFGTPKGTIARDAAETAIVQAKDEFDDHQVKKYLDKLDEVGWDGDNSGDEWTLREKRECEAGRWWTEEQIDGYTDPLLHPNTALPFQISRYTLVKPRTPLLSISIALPTTNSARPLICRAPVSEQSVFTDVLSALDTELGLPKISDDLLGPELTRRTTSRSRSSSLFQNDPSVNNVGQNVFVHWKIQVGERLLRLNEDILEALRGMEDKTVQISLDEDWLFEKRPPVSPTIEQGSSSLEEEDRKSTLKASTSQPLMAALAEDQKTPSPSCIPKSDSRLSNLFHAWAESNAHPAPPSTPQLEDISGLPKIRRPILDMFAQPEGSRRCKEDSESPGDKQQRTDLSRSEPVFVMAGQDVGSAIKGSSSPESGGRTQPRLSSPHNPSSPPSASISPPRPTTFISLSTGTSAGISRLLPQLTGSTSGTGSTPTTPRNAQGGWKRFSLAGLAGWVDTPPKPDSAHLSAPADVKDDDATTPKAEYSAAEKALTEIKPLEKQVTGGLWSWWTGSTKPEAGSPASFIEAIRDSRKNSQNLLRHLISLRVTLSTAKMQWINQFILLDGIPIINKVLSKQARQVMQPGDSTQQVIGEVGKCLRMLMNTESGFNAVIENTGMITSVTLCLRVPSLKVRAQVVDLLSGLVTLAPIEGRRLVLDGLSDLSQLNGDDHRFDFLMRSFGHEPGSDGVGEEPLGLWEWRTSALAFLSVLCNASEEVEERVELRGELRRRGLYKILEELGESEPPDGFLNHLDLFSEDGEDDLVQLRELYFGEIQNPRLAEVVHCLLRITEDLNAQTLSGILEGCLEIAELHDHETLYRVLATFIKHISSIDNISEDWTPTLRSFLVDLNDLIHLSPGRKDSISEGRLMESFAEEVHGLQTAAKELREANAILRKAEENRNVELAVLRELSGEKDGAEGVVHHLMIKEKEIKRLQVELRHLQEQVGLHREVGVAMEMRDRERLRFDAMIEEVTALRKKVDENDQFLKQKIKQVEYLERALETIRSRLLLPALDSAVEEKGQRENMTDVEGIVSAVVERWAKQETVIKDLRREVEQLKKAREQDEEIRRAVTVPIASTDVPGSPPPPPAPPPPPPPPRTVIIPG